MVVLGEAIVIILDVGSSMQSGKDSPTILEEAKECVSMIVRRKIFSESKDELAVILCGSTDTGDSLAEEYIDDCANITVVQDLKPVNWTLLEFINDLKGTDISTEYIIDNALLAATNMLICGIKAKKKYTSQKIVFLSCFEGYTESGKLVEISEQLQNYKIHLNVISPVAFPVENVESSSPVKYENGISEILAKVKGESFSFSDVIPTLIIYPKKEVNPRPWNIDLVIGTDTINATIPVGLLLKISETTPKPWKNAYAHKPDQEVARKSTYYMKDDLQTEISGEDFIHGYKFGTTLVPFSKLDKESMDYQAGNKGMQVLGFTRADKVLRWYYSDKKTHYVFAQKNNEYAGETLSSLIQALHDTNMVAIVRYVYSARSNPKIGFLAPRIKTDYECLIFAVLPFMEDLRHFAFTSLDSDSRNVPTDEQLNAIDDLITTMDLTVPFEEDQEEFLKPKTTQNPYLQRLYQCLYSKALHPGKPLPDVEPHVQAILDPPQTLLQRAEIALKKVATQFPLKEAVIKKTSEKPLGVQNGKLDESMKRPTIKKEPEGEEKSITEEDLIDAIADKIDTVGTVNPVRDFQYLVKNKVYPFNDICQQVIDVVFKILQSSSQLKLYHPKILSICKEFRNTSIKESNPDKYNDFLKKLHNALLECDEQLWSKILSEKIGLISKREVPTSAISVEEAEMFLANSVPSENQNSSNVACTDANEDEDSNDLMDLL